MILRFRADAGQASNLRVRVYSQDRSTLLATLTAATVPDPITETIAGAGTYECEVGALTGYWYVVVDFLDTGEIAADGFANQWTPEVIDSLTASTTGSGLYLVSLTIKDSGGNAVAGAAVTVQNSAGTSNVAWGQTDASGVARFSLDADTYTVLVSGTSAAYATLSPQTLVVSAATSATYTLTTQAIDPPASPGLCTVRFLVQDSSGNVVRGARVSAELVDKTQIVDTALISRSVLSGTTNPSGYVDLVMIQFASFVAGGVYKVDVVDANKKSLYSQKVTVPTVSSAYASDLVAVS